LGQKQDFSAVAVVEREDRRMAFLAPTMQSMRVRYLERLPLGTPYAEVVSRVGEIMRHPAPEAKSRLVLERAATSQKRRLARQPQRLRHGNNPPDPATGKRASGLRQFERSRRPG
jgi:hypothetical protein